MIGTDKKTTAFPGTINETIDHTTRHDTRWDRLRLILVHESHSAGRVKLKNSKIDAVTNHTARHEVRYFTVNI
jgi:hypothetical protein